MKIRIIGRHERAEWLISDELNSTKIGTGGSGHNGKE